MESCGRAATTKFHSLGNSRQIRQPETRLNREIIAAEDHHRQSGFEANRIGAKRRDFRSSPGAPLLIPEECSAENNSVTVAWQPPPGHGIIGCAGQRGPAIEGYLLELDDGCGGEFRNCSGSDKMIHGDRLALNDI
ncbi:e3 ubiquitin-protein ligase trim9-like protein [Lasius niger]|uniref:E3 ubiquitin-protein ligase trim9-like protein n=1 Tax=Lasius niger TaxID=67767 RepID=A0A0J7NVY1_LASNI|nr:e3 ubiquitin-protein ligase trim9-like protein [Lasius niger]